MPCNTLGRTRQPNAGLLLSAGGAHRKQEEQLGELTLPKVVYEVLLGICAQAGDVVILGTALLAQCKDALPHILRDLQSASEITS